MLFYLSDFSKSFNQRFLGFIYVRSTYEVFWILSCNSISWTFNMKSGNFLKCNMSFHNWSSKTTMPKYQKYQNDYLMEGNNFCFIAIVLIELYLKVSADFLFNLTWCLNHTVWGVPYLRGGPTEFQLSYKTP